MIQPGSTPWLVKAKDARPDGVVRMVGLVGNSGQALCGQVMDRPGKHGDWICRQMSVKSSPTKLCRLHGGDDVPIGMPGEEKRAALLDQLGLTNEFKAYREDRDLTDLKHEIALVDIQISRVMKAGSKSPSKENGQEFRELIKLRKQLVDSDHKNRTATVPRDRVMAFMYAITTIACKYVKDPREKAAMLQDIRAISGRHTEQLKITDAVDVTSVPSDDPSDAEPDAETEATE